MSNIPILTKQELHDLTRSLIECGEDEGELTAWLAIYDLLTDAEKESLCMNLKKELEELKKVSQ